MKTKSSGAGAVFMKRRAPEPEVCHFYDSAALNKCTILNKKLVALLGLFGALLPGAQQGLMAPGARSKFGAPMFEPAEIFWKQMHIEESTCDIFGTFQRPP